MSAVDATRLSVQYEGSDCFCFFALRARVARIRGVRVEHPLTEARRVHELDRPSARARLDHALGCLTHGRTESAAAWLWRSDPLASVLVCAPVEAAVGALCCYEAFVDTI